MEELFHRNKSISVVRMDIAVYSESDLTVDQTELVDILRRFEEGANRLLGVEPLLKSDLHLFYVPIIMNDRHREGYPEKLHRSIKDRKITCRPHINHIDYIASSTEDRFKLVVKGSLRAIPLIQKFYSDNEVSTAYSQAILSLYGH